MTGMSSGRRTNDRRRRVLFSANQPETIRATAASRREVERLREARRPIAAYGSRVHRRLRARWFSLVPVRRRTLITLSSVLMGIALLMSLAHYAAVAWPALAYQPDIARPLRIDRPDSFASWFTCLLLAASSGATLLIYQLRRYRSDDYQGRYRLWRLVLVVMLIASINSLVSLIDWSGAILDVAFGKRVALTGSDWIHLVVSIGGAVLALRLLAELRQCRFALGMMLLSCLLLAIPEAARWNVLKLDTLGKWALATSAPLIAVTSLFVAFGAYLRMLYREVRQIEDTESLRERFQQMRLKLFGRSPDVDAEAETEAESESEPKRRWWSKSTKKTPPLVSDQPEDAYEEDQNEEEEYEEEQEEQEEVAEDETEQVARPKRRWFGLRSAKPAVEDAGKDAGKDEEEAAEETSEQPAVAKQKRGWFSRRKAVESDNQEEPASEKESAARDEPPAPKKSGGWFSMRLQPKAKAEEQPAAEESKEAEETDDEAPKRKRFGSGWFGGKKSKAPEASSESESAEADDDGGGDEEYIDPDSIDWDTVSKAERRRLRKLIKRQGRAA